MNPSQRCWHFVVAGLATLALALTACTGGTNSPSSNRSQTILVLEPARNVTEVHAGSAARV